MPANDGVYESELYEDDGLSFDFREGAAYTTTFRLHREGERLTLTAVTTGNGYAEFAREAFHLVVHGAAPETVILDGEEVGVEDGRFHLSNAGTGFELEMTLAV